MLCKKTETQFKNKSIEYVRIKNWRKLAKLPGSWGGPVQILLRNDLVDKGLRRLLKQLGNVHEPRWIC
jgi:hypothetical protein